MGRERVKENKKDNFTIVRIEMNPPSIGKYRRPTARLTNEERKNINEFGLTIPSKKTANYEPNVNEHALLMNSRYNYKNKARANKTASWNNYLKQRKNANTRRNNTKKNNTKRSLF